MSCSSLRHSGMARVNNRSWFYLPPTCLSTSGVSQSIFVSLPTFTVTILTMATVTFIWIILPINHQFFFILLHFVSNFEIASPMPFNNRPSNSVWLCSNYLNLRKIVFQYTLKLDYIYSIITVWHCASVVCAVVLSVHPSVCHKLILYQSSQTWNHRNSVMW